MPPVISDHSQLSKAETAVDIVTVEGKTVEEIARALRTRVWAGRRHVPRSPDQLDPILVIHRLFIYFLRELGEDGPDALKETIKERLDGRAP